MTYTLVTGGCGFIGQHLVRALLDRGDRVVVVDDLSTGNRDCLPRHPQLSLVTASIMDQKVLAHAAADADRIFHLAGLVGMRLATARRTHTYQVSTTGTRNLLACTRPVPTVLFSSSAVYGLSPLMPAIESPLPPEAENLAYDGGKPGYSLGKRHLEDIGRKAAMAGRPVLLIRPFNVTGPGQVSSYGMVLPTFIAHAMAGKPLPLFGNGQQTRSFSHVTTFIDDLIRLTAIPEAWHLPERAINLGTSQPVTIKELARQVIAITGSSSTIESVPFDQVFPSFKDAWCRVPDTSRATALLGPTRWPSLTEIIKSVRDHFASDELQSAPRSPLKKCFVPRSCHGR